MHSDVIMLTLALWAQQDSDNRKRDAAALEGYNQSYKFQSLFAARTATEQAAHRRLCSANHGTRRVVFVNTTILLVLHTMSTLLIAL